MEETWDDDETPKSFQSTSTTAATAAITTTTTQKLGIGRGKVSFTSSNTNPPPEPAPATKWNGGNSNTFSNNFRNNDENNQPNGQASRGFPSRGSFRTGNDGNSRGCYNCNQIGHTSRDCAEPRKDTRTNRGGFHSGTSDRGGFRSGNNDGETKSTFGGWRGGAQADDSNQTERKPAFASNFSSRGSFSNGSGAFRGGRGGGESGSRDFGEQKKTFGGGSNAFFDGGRRNDRVSDDIFDQPGGRGGGGNLQPVERYIPPPPPTTEADIFGEAVTKGENFGKYHRAQVRCTPEGRVKAIELYEEANLSTQVLSNIRRAHFEEPTPIQRYALPCIRQQDDLMACAQTGSGKTAAFLLPIISNLLDCHADELAERNHPPTPLCLVVSPTRELALQTEREARKFAYQTPIIPCSAVGGHDMFTVSDRLREGCHILSATTGRLKDMVEKGRISLKKVKYFVLDEADRMLDTGFEPDIRKLEALGLPSKDERVTAMFSATFPDEVQRLAKHFLRENYIFLAVGILGGANEDIAQTIELVPQASKKDRLFQLLEENLKSERCLIFVETKRSADYIGALLSQRNFMSTTMHGDRTQRQRIEAVQQFTNGKCPILVATSVAARGLDFPLIGYVVNYDLPDTSDFYIHRIGRTGRAGHLGKSISFFDPDRESDRSIAPELVQKLSEAGQEVPQFLQQYVEGANKVNGYGYSSKSVDMRSNAANAVTFSQSSGPAGGTTSAGDAEDWD